MIKLALLTCGRSDFSIYYPLIKHLEKSPKFNIRVIAFGSHISNYHGYTVKEIHEGGFECEEIATLLSSDSEDSISFSMGATIIRFADYWKHNSFDWVIALGDRYEMFSAVASSVPFNFKVAHIHGGEKTLGAIDNAFRHSITAMSSLHFTSCEAHANRVKNIIETEDQNKVFNSGSIALSDIERIEIYNPRQFKDSFNIDLSKKTVLITLHPETKNPLNNKKILSEIKKYINLSKLQFLVTLPNNDTNGSFIREEMLSLEKNNHRVFCYDYLGVNGYFSAMKHCFFMLGNSSSGIIEAASFGCWVLNVGNRQRGRVRSENVFDCEASSKDFLEYEYKFEKLGAYSGENIFYNPNCLTIISRELERK